METVNRFSKFFLQRQQSIVGVLGAFVKLIVNGTPQVRSRACYLLLKVIKSLRPVVASKVDTLIAGLQPLLLTGEICTYQSKDLRCSQKKICAFERVRICTVERVRVNIERVMCAVCLESVLVHVIDVKPLRPIVASLQLLLAFVAVNRVHWVSFFSPDQMTMTPRKVAT